MPSPYRESDNTPPRPLEELEWRRRVGNGTRWAQFFLVGSFGLVVAGRLPLGQPTLPIAVTWLVAGVGLLVAAWILTVPRAGCRVDWRGWFLRGSIVAWSGVTGLLHLGVRLETAAIMRAALAVVAGAVHVARLFDAIGDPRNARKHRGSVIWLALCVALLGVAGLAFHVTTPWGLAGVVVLLWASSWIFQLRAAMLVHRHQWWFDTGMGAPGEWASMLVHRDKQVEVLRVDETLGWFTSEAEAVGWLEENGYVPAQRALAERLVDNVPPDVLPVRRRRRRLRVAQSEARVRVEAGTPDETATNARDGTIHELDESAAAERLDTAEPARSLAVEKPHDR